ncbi:MAG: hypothetical protein V3V08_11780 [Nannocystaceae bacterium]
MDPTAGERQGGGVSAMRWLGLDGRPEGRYAFVAALACGLAWLGAWEAGFSVLLSGYVVGLVSRAWEGVLDSSGAKRCGAVSRHPAHADVSGGEHGAVCSGATTAFDTAGPAEVARDVLHDVGNILNSVNVSADLMCEVLSRSKLPNLRKSVELMKARGSGLDDWATFSSTTTAACMCSRISRS